MQRLSLFRCAGVVLLLAGLALGQPPTLQVIPLQGGDGSDGFFNPVTDIVIDTDVQSVYNFHDVVIPAGVRVDVVGSKPLLILVVDNFVLDGVIDGSGKPGGDSGDVIPGGSGGLPGPAGDPGGHGGAHPSAPFFADGRDGAGAARGRGGFAAPMLNPPLGEPIGGGGGAGNAVAGDPGQPANSGLAPNRSGNGGPAMAAVIAGGGGGGGAARLESLVDPAANDGGAGGGGGGGWIRVTANGNIFIGATGSILVGGGAGGTSLGGGGGGGGGAGGCLTLSADSAVVVDGLLDAQGGAGGPAVIPWAGASPGGDGGDGAVELYGDTVSVAGSVGPAPHVAPVTLVVDKDNYVPVSFDVRAGAGNPFFVGFSLGLLAAPLNFAPQPFWLDPNEPLFQALFPVNGLPANFSGLQGVGTGRATFDIGAAALAGNPQVVSLWVQVVSDVGTGFEVSDLYEVRVIVH